MTGTPEGVPPDVWAGLRAALVPLTPWDRKDVFDAIIAGYCYDCGQALRPSETCHCTNDD